MKTHAKLLTADQINELLTYHYQADYRTDSRPDVVSKHPRWNIDAWPQHSVKSVLDQVLNYNYTVEEVIFNQSRISFRLHVDSGNGDESTLGHAVIIPLMTAGPSATAFFDNYWYGPSTKFSQIQIDDFEYELFDSNHQKKYVPDLRKLLTQCQVTPDTVTDFVVTDEFTSMLEYLIAARNNQAISKRDNRCYDYTNIQNYCPQKKFSEKIHCQWLQHIPIENLHGLSIDQIVEWVPGDAIVFDRKQLHCAAAGHQEKIGITIFTRKP